MLAILVDVVSVLRGTNPSGNRLLRVERHDALSWLTNRGGYTSTSPFSADSICDELGIDLVELRRVASSPTVHFRRCSARPTCEKLTHTYQRQRRSGTCRRPQSEQTG
jgi:hypothetical protein